MQVLFLHNNFPAQFGRLSQFLLEDGVDVWFGTQRKNSTLAGVKVFNYEPHRAPTDKVHPYAANFEQAVLNGQAVARAALKLKEKGLQPDIVVAHSGWGPGLFVKELWPTSKYIGYFEWYYHADAPDVLHLNDQKRSLDDLLRGHGRNAAILMDLASCDAGICPTRFQIDQFPDCFKSKLNVIHDGVDTDAYHRKAGVKPPIDGVMFNGKEQFVTYVARGMEPYRGFPEFMKALEIVQKARPGVHGIIVGEDRVAYGKKLKEGESFKKLALNELDLDLSRTHFTGLLPRNRYLEVLQASTVHAFLSIPFVLSWSMMEAMSTECAIVASDNESVRELIEHDRHGVLVNLRDPPVIAEAILQLLDDEKKRRRLGHAARARIVSSYDGRELYLKRKKLFTDILKST